MVKESKAGYFKTKSGKYLIHLPKELAEDTMRARELRNKLNEKE